MAGQTLGRRNTALVQSTKLDLVLPERRPILEKKNRTPARGQVQGGNGHDVPAQRECPPYRTFLLWFDRPSPPNACICRFLISGGPSHQQAVNHGYPRSSQGD